MMDNQTMTIDDKKLTTHSTPIGARFKTARETMGLSEKDAALHLHLNPKIITLIENNDFQNTLLPAAFLRGHLRSYARLLNINEEEINATLQQLGVLSTPTTIKSPILQNSPINNTSDGSSLRWLTYFIVLILFVLVAIWWNSHPRDIVIHSVVKSEPAPVTPTTAPTQVLNLTPAEPQISTPLQPLSTSTSAAANAVPPTEPLASTETPAPETTPAAATTTPDAMTAPQPEAAPVTKPKRKRVKPAADDAPQLNMSLPSFNNATE